MLVTFGSERVKFTCILLPSIYEEQGWRSGESACLPLLWPGFDSWIWHHTWVEFVVDSRPCIF